MPISSRITAIQTECFRIPLPRTLADAKRKAITHFQLITVHLRDAEGESGLGYTYTVGQGGTAIRTLIDDELVPLLIGCDPRSIEVLWERMNDHLHYVGRGGIASFAMSAVDIALWDLQARKQNLPLWTLLGADDKRVPVYAGGINLNFSTEDLLREAKEVLGKGFRAVKMKVGSPELETDLQRVAAMRHFLGPDTPLMVDANMAWTADEAIAAARALQPFDVYWLEEPVAPDDFRAHARVMAEGGLPVAAGENLHTLREFEMLIDSGGVHFVEPDVANIGGVTAWLQVAARAEQAGLPVTSHGVHDLHVHLLAAANNSSYLEWHGFGLERFMSSRLRIENGQAIATDSPGHGVRLNREALRPYAEPLPSGRKRESQTL